MAEIPVQPKRTPEIPVQAKRRRSVWPWVVGLLALLLLPFLFARSGPDDTIAASDTSVLVDTAIRFDGRTIGTVGGAVAPRAGAAPPAGSVLPADTAARSDSAPPADTTARADTTGPR